MSYGTTTTWALLYGSVVQTRLADRDASGSADTGVLQGILDRCASIIDAYNTDLTSTEAAYVEYDLATHFLYLQSAGGAGGVPRAIQVLYDSAISLLESRRDRGTDGGITLLTDPADQESDDLRTEYRDGADDFVGI